MKNKIFQCCCWNHKNHKRCEYLLKPIVCTYNPHTNNSDLNIGIDVCLFPVLVLSVMSLIESYHAKPGLILRISVCLVGPDARVVARMGLLIFI